MIKELCINIFIPIVFCVLINFDALGQADCDCDYIVQPADEYVNGGALNVGPGDVVCVMASSKRFLGFINFHGAPGNPIIFKNCGGQVVIRDTDWYYAFKFDNCSFFKFTGTGSPNYDYGFLVDGTPHGIVGLGISKMSTDFEVDHIEIGRTGFAGIHTKTDPDCSGIPNHGNFVQRNTLIHDNYVHDTGGEGIYVGFPHSRGEKIDCEPDSMHVLPHDLVGLKIYKNRIENTGKEGLQVGCAVDANIYENSIFGYGKLKDRFHWYGVQIGTGTSGNFYSNYITDGPGPGIWLNGSGNNYLYNNVIANVGTEGQDGIMIHDSVVVSGTGYHIINNTIVNPGGNGVKVYTNRNTLINFKNNIVAGAGKELISVPAGNNFVDENNIMDFNISKLQFEDVPSGNYRLKEISPAVETGIDMSSFRVVDDYEYIARPRGKKYDVGAFESPYEKLTEGFFISPNPINTIANITFTVPMDTEGSLKVYDVFGRVVAIIDQGTFYATKEYNYVFDSFFLAQGIYYYTLEANGKRQVIKVLMVE